jgi:hypothetical protein
MFMFMAGAGTANADPELGAKLEFILRRAVSRPTSLIRTSLGFDTCLQLIGWWTIAQDLEEAREPDVKKF